MKDQTNKAYPLNDLDRTLPSLDRFSARDIRVRLGEYRFNTPTDSAHVDFDILDVRMHNE